MMNILQLYTVTISFFLLTVVPSCKETPNQSEIATEQEVPPTVRSVNEAAVEGMRPKYPTTDGKRVALLIGNDKYDPRLPLGKGLNLSNAQRDAEAVSVMLIEELGFVPSQVLSGYNVTRRKSFVLLEEFKELAKDAELIIIFYAGHGMESRDGNENFLLPVDTEVRSVAKSDAMLRANGLALSEMLRQVSQVCPNGAKVALLDCCRDRPRGRSLDGQIGGGLVDVSRPHNTLVLLAAAPGHEASDGSKHSPLTQALLEKLPVPGQNLLDGFFEVSERVENLTAGKQIPWLRADGSLGTFRKIVLREDKIADVPKIVDTNLQKHAKWEELMKRMKQDYVAAEQLGKFEAWEKYVEVYGEIKNPYTRLDEELLGKAKSKMRDFNLKTALSIYVPGKAFQKDFIERVDVPMLRQSAENGDSTAQFLFGRLNTKSVGFYDEPERAIYWYEKSEASGNVDAMLNLSKFYLHGVGVPKDVAKGLGLLEKSAAGGQRIAQYLYGKRCLTGDEIPKNLNKGIGFLLKSGRQGYLPAIRYLAIIYAEGLYVKEDEVKALPWIKLAAEQGDAHCQWLLGNRLNEGRRIGKDSKKARHWWRKAGAQGYSNALGCLDVNDLIRRAEAGDFESISCMAWRLKIFKAWHLRILKGDINKWQEESMKWCKMAAEKGSGSWQFELGRRYFSGDGVPKNLESAKKWWSLSAEQGNEEAKEQLELLKD